MKTSVTVGMVVVLTVLCGALDEAAAAPIFGGGGSPSGRDLWTINTDATLNTSIDESTGIDMNGLAYDAASDTLYGMHNTGGGMGNLFTVDTSDGSLTLIAEGTTGASGLTYVASTGILWGINTTSIYQYDTSDGSVSNTVALGRRGDGLANVNGTLYFIEEGTSTTSGIYRIDDTSTGANTLIATLTGTSLWGTGLAYDPETGLLYASGELRQLYSINPETGVWSFIGTVPDGVANSPDGIYCIYGLAPTIPEPVTLAVLAVGSVLVLLRRRRS